MNFDNKDVPKCMNLYNVNLNTGFFNTNLNFFFKTFFNMNESDFSSVVSSHTIGQKLLNNFTVILAKRLNISTKSFIQVDIKNDLIDSKDFKQFAKDHSFQQNFTTTINIGKLKAVAKAINIIFSTAGCKGEEIQKDELCYLNLAWENKNFLTPKFEILNSNLNSQENFNQLRKDKLFFDCTFEVENQFIPIHRCLLAVKSPVFYQMFKNEWTKDKIMFPDENLKTIQLFLDYLYQDYTIVANDLDELLTLIKFAHRYDVKSLFKSCVSLLHKEIMNFENIIDIYLFGEQLDSKEIIDDCEHKSILINWERDKPAIDVSSLTNLTELLKIYKVAKQGFLIRKI